VTDVLTQAVLLLAAHLGRSTPGQPKPLGPSEYGRLAHWLYEHELEPSQLLMDDPGRVLSDWHDPKIPVERIRYLVGRSAALGLELEKWERAGLWVITRASPTYPVRLKRQLKADAPPFLIGCGNPTLLNTGGLAVVGSRDATMAELSLATRLGRCAAAESVSLVSGGAHGVDETAMLAAIDAGGTAVGVLADHLLRAATSKKQREGLMADRVALVSPFNPEAGFDVGNAMSRNRYIYCLADAAVVVATGNGSVGTWNGAMQNLKEGWVPLWVNRDIAEDAGGGTLVAKGAHWLPEGDFRVAELLMSSERPPELPVVMPAADSTAACESGVQVAADSSTIRVSADDALRLPRAPDDDVVDGVPNDFDFYNLFLHHVRRAADAQAVSAAELSASFDLHKAQVDAWLARAVSDGHLRKLTRPVRYALTGTGTSQPQLFG